MIKEIIMVFISFGIALSIVNKSIFFIHNTQL